LGTLTLMARPRAHEITRLVVVAGASNSGVSAVVETFGPRGGPPAVTRVAVPASATTPRETGQENRP